MEQKHKDRQQTVKLQPLTNWCRICFGNNDLQPFFPLDLVNTSENYYEIIINCFRIEINPEGINAKNNHICNNCIKRLQEASDFKSLIEKSLIILQKSAELSLIKNNEDIVVFYENGSMDDYSGDNVGLSDMQESFEIVEQFEDIKTDENESIEVENVSLDELCEVFTSQRERIKICARGYTMVLDKSRESLYYWRCAKRMKDCKGRAITQCVDGLHYIQRFVEHCHPPQPNSVSRANALKRMKDLAKNTDESAQRIVQICSSDVTIRPFIRSKETLLKLIRRIRQKQTGKRTDAEGLSIVSEPALLNEDQEIKIDDDEDKNEIIYTELCDVIPSQRGRDKICTRGYTMVLERTRDDNFYYWRCTHRDLKNCKGRAITYRADRLHYVQRFVDHNHDPQPNLESIVLVFNRVKDLASNTDEPAQKIIETVELESVIDSYMPTRESLTKLINRIRRKRKINLKINTELDDEVREKNAEIILDELCEIIPSQRGGAKICARGYPLALDKRRDNMYYWRCAKRSLKDCKGRATTYCLDGQHYVQRFVDHNHTAQPSISSNPIQIKTIMENQSAVDSIIFNSYQTDKDMDLS